MFDIMLQTQGVPQGPQHWPDANSEHIEDMPALQPPQEHDDSDDTERIEWELFAQLVHADL